MKVRGIRSARFRGKLYYWKRAKTGFANIAASPFSAHAIINYSPSALRSRVFSTGSNPILRATRFVEIDLGRFLEADSDTQETDLEGTELSHTQSE